MSPYLPVIRHPVFSRVLPGLVLSALGDGMSAVAVGWLALQLAPDHAAGTVGRAGRRGVHAARRRRRGRCSRRCCATAAARSSPRWDGVLRAVFLGAIALLAGCGGAVHRPVRGAAGRVRAAVGVGLGRAVHRHRSGPAGRAPPAGQRAAHRDRGGVDGGRAGDRRAADRAGSTRRRSWRSTPRRFAVLAIVPAIKALTPHPRARPAAGSAGLRARSAGPAPARADGPDVLVLPALRAGAGGDAAVRVVRERGRAAVHGVRRRRGHRRDHHGAPAPAAAVADHDRLGDRLRPAAAPARPRRCRCWADLVTLALAGLAWAPYPATSMSLFQRRCRPGGCRRCSPPAARCSSWPRRWARCWARRWCRRPGRRPRSSPAARRPRRVGLVALAVQLRARAWPPAQATSSSTLRRSTGAGCTPGARRSPRPDPRSARRAGRSSSRRPSTVP